MCIIIDANKIHEFFNATENAKPIHAWIANKGGRVVYADVGEFKQELTEKFKNQLESLSRSGQATLIDSEQVLTEQTRLQQAGHCISNDLHILALAIVSGARLLYTGDDKLIKDFKNREIISQPRGNIYSRAANKNLLKPNACNRIS